MHTPVGRPGNGMQISPYKNEFLHKCEPGVGRYVLKNGQNLVNAVCERPPVSHISDLKECQMQKKKKKIEQATGYDSWPATSLTMG